MRRRQDQVRRIQEETARRQREAVNQQRGLQNQRAQAQVQPQPRPQPQPGGLLKAFGPMTYQDFLASTGGGMGGGLLNQEEQGLNQLLSSLDMNEPDPMDVFGPATYDQMYPPNGQYFYHPSDLRTFQQDYIRRAAEIMNMADPSLINSALMAARHQRDLLNAPGTFDALGDITQQYGLPGEIGGEIADFLYGSNPTRANFGLPPLNRPQSLSAARYNADPFDISNDFNLPDYLQPQNMPTNSLTGQINPSFWQQQPSMGAMPQFQGYPL